MERYELGSEPWLDVMRAELADGLTGEDLDGIEFTLSEEYTDPPAHLRRGGAATIGWHMRISGGRFEVVGTPLDDADLRVVADYNALLPIAHEIHPDGGPTPETEAAIAALVAANKLELHGDRRGTPAVLAQVNLHNRLAPRTA
jgi:hypothetical protein